MIKREFHLQLDTPAFLGDADQKGVWRTPPLKALLREWWRVAVAAEVGCAVQPLKARELALFGTAADDAGSVNQRSRVRLALQHWEEGGLTDWGQVNPGANGRPGEDPKVTHPEVEFAGGRVGSQLYLGYGPLVLEKGSPSPRLKSGAALQAGATNTLKLAFATDWPDKAGVYPENVTAHLDRALSLAHWFGTLGGRSRNGWGSLALLPISGGGGEPGGAQVLPRLSRATLAETGCLRPLARCLELDWAHAVGADEAGPLVWQSRETFADWREAMRFMAQVKIGFRTHLGFSGGQPHAAPQARHVLAYPVTHHKVPAWEGTDKGRLANTLRFKLHPAGAGRLRALIFHTPCRPTLPHAGVNLAETWRLVHRWLDDPAARPEAFRNLNLTRLP